MIREQVLGIVAMEPMGEYSANVKYEKLNIVTYNGSTYSALKDTLGNEPTNDEYWQLIAKKGDKGDTYELTDEDKENIKNDITENANSDFNKNVESKTNTFNDNVTEKTSSFNTNVENKTKEFNDNSTTKLEEFNTNSTNKLEEYNTNANAKLNEYNANADGVMTIAVDTRNELERVKNDVLETGEANGSYLHLEDSTMAELQELEVSSNEKQVTTTGKNLFETIINTHQEALSGLTVTQNNDGSVHIQGTGTTNWSNITISTPIKIEPNIDYCFSINKATNYSSILKITFEDDSQEKIYIYSGETYKKFQVTQNVKNVYAYIYDNNNFPNINETLYFQVEKGSTPTSYEKYTGGTASPNPEYPQDIPMITTDSVLKSIGSNLWNLNVSQDSRVTINEDGTITINGSGGFGLKIEPITLKAGKTYYEKFELISGSITGTTSVFLSTEPGLWLSDKNYVSHTLLEDKVKNSMWVNASATFNNAVIRLWATEGERKEYEPYQETVLNLPIPEGEFVGYINDNAKDRFRVGYNEEDGNYHLYLDKVLGKYNFDGSEHVAYFQETNEGKYIIAQFFMDNVLERSIVKSNLLVNLTNGWNWEKESIDSGGADYKRIQFKILSSRLSSLDKDGVKAWMTANKPEVVYQLAEPYTLDLGVVDMPLSYDGTTNIFVDTDLLMNINTKYYRNFTETIRNLQINNDTLKNELVNINNRLSNLEAAQASVVSESEVEE